MLVKTEQETNMIAYVIIACHRNALVYEAEQKNIEKHDQNIARIFTAAALAVVLKYRLHRLTPTRTAINKEKHNNHVIHLTNIIFSM